MPRAAGRPPTGTIAVPAFRRVDRRSIVVVTPAAFFIRRQVGLAKVHPCIEFGVVRSKFTFTGGPLVKKIFLPWRVQPTPHRDGNHNGF